MRSCQSFSRKKLLGLGNSRKFESSEYVNIKRYSGYEILEGSMSH